MPYLNEAGLAYYDPKLKEWISTQPAKTIPSTLYPWTLTDKAGAVTCWPVGGTQLLPTVDFLFTEVPPASGDKGPENPSTISGVSEVKVTHGNKNYVSLPYHTPSVTRENVTWTINTDGSVTAVGTASPTSNFYFTGHGTTNLRLVPNRKYFLHGCPSGGSASTFGQIVTCGAGDTYSIAYDYGNGAVFIPKTHDANVIVSARISSGYSANLVFKPQLEDGETGTIFEVVPRNVYTLPLNGTYYGGTLDVATGVMTVTHTVYDIGESITNYSTSNAVFYFDSPIADTATSPTCESFVFNQVPLSSLANGEFRYQLDSSIPQGSIRWLFKTTDYSDVESFSAAFAGKKLVYKLATPYTIQLTPTEILSLVQADKYTPRLNTVYTDASAVQVGYVKSPIREEQELTQAIVAQGGNV